MAYTLVGSRYIGTGSLPTPVAGYDAIDTSTGDQYVSNTSGTAWVTVGNVNTTNLGLLPVSGGVMTGAITGATGWAPSDSANFATKAYIAGIDIGTTDQLATLKTEVMDSITPKITEAIASTVAAVGVNSKVAKSMGVLTFTPATAFTIPAVQTIPLPTYPSGEVAKESECVWCVFPVELTYATGNAGGMNESLFYSVDPTTTRTFSAYTHVTSGAPADLVYQACKIGYMIIGIKV